MSKKSASHSSRPTKMSPDTSWESIAQDYNKAVDRDGHFYHREVILPNLLSKLQLSPSSSLVDIGCGQGVLEKQLPKKLPYLGIDLSPSLLRFAKKNSGSRSRQFLHHDMTHPLPETYHNQFSHAVAILSLQNMESPAQAISHAAQLLAPQGRLFIILNHPCFRIPRLSSWFYDEPKKLMSRKIDRYLSPLSVPIVAHPGEKHSETTYSFHFPLSYWVQSLSKTHLLIDNMEEWTSPKKSSGKRAKAENLCRKEFPLFLFISAIKRS
ncbi:class I SAM-dependent methyltransferase [Chlamydia muridarum str. Nigg]|uniref:Methylase n=2 Tax=Chlamydia muridarum TaxID=83560 RepID=A0A069ZRD9_CHLMR|nr:class I SAM-dependent methyltransferase [Chlamydia muridarum]UFT29161.1 class I SAM-dependent methyltransferase [Chlamydia trachomatis]AAF39266.1 conserved hypothetical protein [Chlamydia muridarum str. Nigg]AHH22795.1 methylase [Chlamydia muridarum str. Nigg3 CMUT3-5]AHH23720.1 methylase [Chlamydia muridarum str. Nigg CM972]AID37934.1 methylase [Chlamydia muridarum str. Nigg 2 MCR]